MNARLLFNRPLLVVWLLLAGFVAQTSQAVAQCTIGWHSDGGCGPAFLTVTGPAGTQVTMGLTIVALTDPARGCSCQFRPGQGMSSYQRVNVITAGQCFGFDMSGNPLTQNANGGYVSNGWPSGSYSGSCGYFDAQMTCNSEGSPAPIHHFYFWVSGSSISACAPSPAPDPGGSLPPSQTTITNGGVVTTVTKSDGTPAQYLSAYLYGPTVQTGRLSASGTITFANCVPGNYSLHILGEVTAANGNASKVDYTQGVTINNGDTATVNIKLNSDGTVSTTNTGHSQQPAPADPNAQPSWAQSLANSLFVPDTAHTDALKGSLNGIYTWGPFALINDIANLSSGPKSTMTPMQISVPSMDSCGCKYTAAPTTQTVPLEVGAITQNSAWASLRALLGGSVWLAFAFALVKHFMPKQQM